MSKAVDVLRGDHAAKEKERARHAARVEQLDAELAEITDALTTLGVDLAAEALAAEAVKRAAEEERAAAEAVAEAEARADAEARAAAQAAANAPPEPPHEVPITSATAEPDPELQAESLETE